MLLVDAGNALVANVLKDATALDYYCDDTWLKDQDPHGNKLGASPSPLEKLPD